MQMHVLGGQKGSLREVHEACTFVLLDRKEV